MRWYRSTDKYKEYQINYKKKNKLKLNAQDSLSAKKRRRENPEKYRLIDKKARERYRKKINIRQRVRDHVLAGKLIKPTHCEGCQSNVKTEAHHEDYTKPLDVVWLCKKCHVIADSN